MEGQRGKSTADSAQVLHRLHEDSRRLKNARETSGEVWEHQLEACLLDLRKAYPRVNRPALWEILTKFGVNGRMLKRLRDLHETIV